MHAVECILEVDAFGDELLERQPALHVQVDQGGGSAAFAGAALPAHRAPVEDDEVADGNVGDCDADRVDDAGGFVAEQEWDSSLMRPSR